MEKPFWQAIVAADYAVPAGHTAAGLASILWGYLGSTDAELRDDFGYGITVRWLDRQLLTPDDIRSWLPTFVDNLQVGLGERDTDTVFLRAFSVLMLAAAVYYDNHKQIYLSETEYAMLRDHSLAYLAAECDLRGYVPEKGWAHAIAHTADLLDELAISRYASLPDLQRILTAVGDKVMAPSGTIFLHNEDDRMSYAVFSALKRGILPREWVAEWLETLGRVRAHCDQANVFHDPGCHSAYLNTKNFLRSLTIRLSADDLIDSVRAVASDARAALLGLR